jgi:hypothetical protein
VCNDDKPYFEFLGKLLKLLTFKVTYDCCYFAKANEAASAELKTIACLQLTSTAAAARACKAYWDGLEQNFMCLNWQMAQRERQKLWADVGFPVSRRR